MSIEAAALDELYARYGFERRAPSPDVRVYVLRHGYFHNADIVPLRAGVSTGEVERQFSASGYAVRVRNFSSASEAAQTLFDGFFSTAETASRLAAHYKAFASKQTRLLGGTYQYIPCPFSTTQGSPPQAGNIVDAVTGIISRPGPQLLLVEAAAGYGKTSTAYEVLRALVTLRSPRNPIFAELARNRQARVFRYVLLDEIDRTYQSLGYDLVRTEIQSGRLPLIIDGFDELLHKGTTLPEGTDGFEQAESMLDTIGDLLLGEAKIVLTTRRTAVFAGDDFHHWSESRKNSFEVTRLSLEEPSVDNWLGTDKASRLRATGLPLDQLSNPVLLTFLRHLEPLEFAECCGDPDRIVERYFNKLLEREQDRQELRLSVEKQLAVFRGLAEEMVGFDISAESRSFIKDLILGRFADVLEEVRKTYSAAERPSLDDLANTLAGHALLDRVGSDENQVGFINDFIFGSLIADNVCDHAPDDWVASEPMINRAATAYRVRSANRREQLHQKLEFAEGLLDAQDQILMDLALLRDIRHDHSGALFRGLTLRSVHISSSVLTDCMFVNCTFTDVTFVAPNLHGVGFLNCKFFDCHLIADSHPDAAVWNAGSIESGSNALERMVEKATSSAAYPSTDYEKAVLEVFWPVGRVRPDLELSLQSVFLAFPSMLKIGASAALRALDKQQLLKISGDSVSLNRTRMTEIRARLGRT